jgi:medium-chain acyl-[acyl-carrier-protein] hydrolase
VFTAIICYNPSFFPKWNDEVTVETWGSGIDRFYALRDFVVRSRTRENLAVATSSWVIFDRATFRPQKLDRLRQRFPFRPGISALDANLEKLPPLTEGEIRSRAIVRFTDLDVNRHVTASRFMQWILDSFPTEVLENSTLRSFEINFMAEAQIGNEIAVMIQPVDAYYLCSIHRPNDQRELCRARLIWNTTSSPP